MRQMAIEDVLIWAFRDELPKAGRLRKGPLLPAAVWQAVEAVGELGTVVDAPVNRYGVVADNLAGSLPHPDAVVVAEAVAALDATMALVWPADWDPIADLGDLGGLKVGEIARAVEVLTSARPVPGRELTWMPATVVRRQAILARPPEWRIDPPAVVPETNGRGGPRWRRLVEMADPYRDGGTVVHEVDGFDKVARRPFPDAFRRDVLEPSITGGIVDRAVWEIWRAALDVLAEDLDGALSSVVVLPSRQPRRPWDGDEPAGPLVHPVEAPASPLEPETAARGRRAAQQRA